MGKKVKNPKKRINSNAKGKAAERAFCQYVHEHWGVELRRSQQYCGRGGESADVIGVEGIHFEIKHVEALNIQTAYEQATNDCSTGSIPVVAHKKNNKPWLITLRPEDLVELAYLIQAAQKALIITEI